MPAERRCSTADTDTALLPREHCGLVSPGVEKELEALDEAEELLAPTIHARDRQAGKRGKRSKADKADLMIDTWLAVMACNRYWCRRLQMVAACTTRSGEPATPASSQGTARAGHKQQLHTAAPELAYWRRGSHGAWPARAAETRALPRARGVGDATVIDT
eukprot:scaffold10234_cov63-Phaeocystis_antarctica.AAC.2